MPVSGPRRLLLPQLLLLLLPLFCSASGAWDPDLELLDLVEEVPQNFYQLLSVDQTAAAADIKRAYRRLSLTLHPDKNKEPDAEEKFRQLVAVYEVLKDEERRKRYDDILEHGLPDWRQPVFYYRRVRKMSNCELSLLLFIIVTVAHYAVLWSLYLEKLLDELLSRKKREKKKKTPKVEIDRDDRCDRTQERPQWQDLLPLKLSMWLYVSLRNLPQTVQEVKSFYEEQQLMKKRLEEEKQQEPQTRERKVKVKKPKLEFPVYDSTLDSGSIHGYDPVTSIEEVEEQLDDWLQEKPGKKACDWSEEELSHLGRLMGRFPGGAPGRWERIALELNRTVTEVTAKVKQVKEQVNHTPSGLVKLSELKAAPPVTSLPADEDITRREGVACDEDGEELGPRRRSQAKARGRRQADFDPEEQEEEEPVPDPAPSGPTPSGPAPSGPAPWTQKQQRLLELALQQFPRGTSDRWTRISAVVPGKTKEECMCRYRTLAELVQKRKQTKTS